MYLLGIDIGTSSAKCLLADLNGNVLDRFSVSYPLSVPRPGWAEQNAQDWFDAALQGIRHLLQTTKLDPADIAGISFSGQMHGLVPIDRSGEVIRPPFLWCDQRTQTQCDKIESIAGGRGSLVSLTNNVMLTGYTGGKILWLKENEPEHYNAMTVFLCPKDYVRFRMTSVPCMDVTQASGTGFFDTKHRCWRKDLITECGLNFDIFPHTIESVDTAGSVTKEIAELTGLLPGTPCFAGGGDAVVQSFGSGLINEGMVGTVIGTAGNVSMGFDSFRENPDGKLQMFCGVWPGLYSSFGATQSAGGALRWFRDELAGEVTAQAKQENKNSFELLGELAMQSPPGANGVVFAPYLSGERCPWPDANARGVLYGLSLSTKKSDIIRAVMEGIVFSLSQIVDIYRSICPVQYAVASGGGAASETFLQMQADIFGLPVRTVSFAQEGGAYGAALIAGMGLKVFSSPQDALKMLRERKCFMPNAENTALCNRSRMLYNELYPALKPLYKLGGD